MCVQANAEVSSAQKQLMYLTKANKKMLPFLDKLQSSVGLEGNAKLKAELNKVVHDAQTAIQQAQTIKDDS